MSRPGIPSHRRRGQVYNRYAQPIRCEKALAHALPDENSSQVDLAKAVQPPEQHRRLGGDLDWGCDHPLAGDKNLLLR